MSSHSGTVTTSKMTLGRHLQAINGKRLLCPYYGHDEVLHLSDMLAKPKVLFPTPQVHRS